MACTFFFCFHAFLDYIWIAYAATWLVGFLFFEAKDNSGISWMFLTKPSLADTLQVYRLLLKVSFFRWGNYFSRTEKDHLLINAVLKQLYLFSTLQSSEKINQVKKLLLPSKFPSIIPNFVQFTPPPLLMQHFHATCHFCRYWNLCSGCRRQRMCFPSRNTMFSKRILSILLPPESTHSI